MNDQTTPAPQRPAFNKPTHAELDRRFVHHPPFGDQAQRYSAIRDRIRATAKFCVEQTPCSPEQSRALNKLDEAMFLFNAAIARNERESEQARE